MVGEKVGIREKVSVGRGDGRNQVSEPAPTGVTLEFGAVVVIIVLAPPIALATHNPYQAQSARQCRQEQKAGNPNQTVNQAPLQKIRQTSDKGALTGGLAYAMLLSNISELPGDKKSPSPIKGHCKNGVGGTKTVIPVACFY